MGAATRAFPLVVAGLLALVVAAGVVDADPRSAQRLTIRADAEVAGAPVPYLDVAVTDPGEVRLGEQVTHQVTIRAAEPASLGDPRIAQRVRAEAGEGELLVGSHQVRWRDLGGRAVSETTAGLRQLVAAPDAPVVEEVTLFTGVADVAVREGRYVVEVPLDVPTAEPGRAMLVLTYDVEAVPS